MALNLRPYDLQAGTGEAPVYTAPDGSKLYQDMTTGKIYRTLNVSAQTPTEAIRKGFQIEDGSGGVLGTMGLPTSAFDNLAGAVINDPEHGGWLMEQGAHQQAQDVLNSSPYLRDVNKEGFLDNLFEMGPFILGGAFGAGALGGAFPSQFGVAGNSIFGGGAGTFGAGPSWGTTGLGAEGLTVGNAPGMGLEGYFQNLSATAPEAAESGLGAGAFNTGSDLSQFFTPNATGFDWTQSLYPGAQEALGMTPAEIAAVNANFPLTSGLGAAAAAGGPFVPNFNPLDPSTFGGGGTNTTSGGIPDFLKSLGMTPGSLLTGLGQGVLGAFGAKSQADAARDAATTQANALKDMQERYLGLGAPYRDLLGASYKPGFSIWDDAATRDAAGRAADISARGYSASAGNPFDSPTAQAGIYGDVLKGVALPQLNTYRGQLGTFGQLGTNQAGTAGLGAAQSMGQAAGASATPGILGAIGGGLGTALNPRTSTDELLRLLQGNRFGSGGSLA